MNNNWFVGNYKYEFNFYVLGIFYLFLNNKKTTQENV